MLLIYQQLEKNKNQSFSSLTKKYKSNEFHLQIFNDLWSNIVEEFTIYRIYIYRTNLTYPFFRDGIPKHYYLLIKLSNWMSIILMFRIDITKEIH